MIALPKKRQVLHGSPPIRTENGYRETVRISDTLRFNNR
jgi:hypothetical protein